jgi:hypothetical protein
LKQEPLVNIGDLVWVINKLGKDHYTSFTAFIFQVNYWGEDNISSYYAQFFDEINPNTISLYGLDFGETWGKLNHDEG